MIGDRFTSLCIAFMWAHGFLFGYAISHQRHPFWRGFLSWPAFFRNRAR